MKKNNIILGDCPTSDITHYFQEARYAGETLTSLSNYRMCSIISLESSDLKIKTTLSTIKKMLSIGTGISKVLNT